MVSKTDKILINKIIIKPNTVFLSKKKTERNGTTAEIHDTFPHAIKMLIISFRL